MPRSRLLLPYALVLLISLSTGCQTVGNYLGNRRRALSEYSFIQAVMGSCESWSPYFVRRKS